MKKQVLLVAAALGMTFATNAQDLTSKSGQAILPESGDIAIGFDASPLFSYIGNMFNGNMNNSFNTGWTNANNAIYGKYYLAPDMAVRGWVRLGFGSTTDNTLVQDLSSTDPDATVTDTQKDSYSSIVIGGGIEMRRGHNRLQGYYGGDLLIGSFGGKTEYTYGNDVSDTNPGLRPTLMAPGGTLMIGLRGVIGVEYFLAPKVSIGAEYAWGLGLSSTGEGETTTEEWDFANSGISENTTMTAKDSQFMIDTDMNNMMFGGGSVKLLFHF